MSDFLPESFTTTTTKQQTQTLDEVEKDDETIKKLLGDFNRLYRTVPQFFTGLLSWLEISGLSLPISQVEGFSQWAPQTSEFVGTKESTASTSYGNLATVGPQMDKLGNGSYFVLWTALAYNDTGGDAAFMTVAANGETEDDNEAAGTYFTSANGTSIVGFTTRRLSTSSGNNTILTRYRAGVGGTAFFARRRMMVIRYQNA